MFTPEAASTRRGNYIFTVRPTVHTNHYENEAFRKRLTSVIYASVLLLKVNFVITLSKFAMEPLWQCYDAIYHQYEDRGIKTDVNLLIQRDNRLLCFNFLLPSVDGNYLMRFQRVKTSFSNFRRTCNPVKHGYHPDHQRVCCIWVTYVNQYRCGTPELNLVKILRISWPKRGHRRHLTSILAYFPGHCVQGRWKLKHNI